MTSASSRSWTTKGNVTGANVTVGGGMGITHGEPDTYPRTADFMGYFPTERAIGVAEAIVTVQRDWGNRDRKHARLKYTIEENGMDRFRGGLEKRVGLEMEAPKTLSSPRWATITAGLLTRERYAAHLTLYVESGRVKDSTGGEGLMPGAAQGSPWRTRASCT